MTKETSAPALDLEAATAIANNPDATPEQLDSAAGVNDIVDRLLARHPKSGAALLEKLSYSSNNMIRTAVVLHPNATKETLVRLAPQFPYTFFKNPAFDVMLLEDPGLLFRLGQGVLKNILKHPECPASFMKWATEYGSEQEKLTVAMNSYAPASVLQLLVQEGGSVGEAARGPRLNDKQVLIGNYPKILDLRKHAFDTEIFLHSSDEFKSAAKEGRPPQSNICISGNDNVETIYFPFDQTGYNYAVVANLPNLRELHVCRRDEHSLFCWSALKWLICQHLPNLKTITVEGDVRWLQLEDMPSLEIIDVSKCKNLDYFSIRNAPALKNVNIKNCKKLRTIADLPTEIQSSLGITKQIQRTQEKSKNNGKIYKNMTFTDIDIVLANINYGAKLATRNRLFPKGYKTDPGFCYGRENDPTFEKFSFQLLRPLEHVYTGGTGETYAYEFLSHDYHNGQYGIGHSIGNSTQERCLDYALSSMANLGLAIPGRRWRVPSKQVLDFLNQLIAEKNNRSPRPK